MLAVGLLSDDVAAAWKIIGKTKYVDRVDDAHCIVREGLPQVPSSRRRPPQEFLRLVFRVAECKNVRRGRE